MAVSKYESLAQESYAISSVNGQEFQLVATHVPLPPPLIALRSNRAVESGRNYAGAPELELGRGSVRSRNFASLRRNGACENSGTSELA